MTLLQTAIDAAQAAAHTIRAERIRPVEIQSKGFRDIVTSADYAAEQAIKDVILARYPEHAILSEEDKDVDIAAWSPPPGAVWVIDPLDGTTNFSRGVPAYSTSVAVIVDGVIEAGAIIDPVADIVFSSARGQGVQVNGQPARVSTVEHLTQSLGACDWPRDPEARDLMIDIITHMLRLCRSVRAQGSAALNLAYVAAGWYDFYLHAQLSPWDMAAAVLMIREAGGAVTTIDGAPFQIKASSILASNRVLHDAVVTEIRAATA